MCETGVSWATNWAPTTNTSFTDIEYVPMLWGPGFTEEWPTAVEQSLDSGSRHALSFNEPDERSQSSITAQEAANLHITLMNPLQGRLFIGSPAVTNGPAPMGLAWLNDFFVACASHCIVDFLAFHWYANPDIAAFQSYVQDVINMATSNGISKVWLTEFGAGTDSFDTVDFLRQALTYLDGNAQVERYAYFMCAEGDLLNGTQLSDTGQVYSNYVAGQ